MTAAAICGLIATLVLYRRNVSRRIRSACRWSEVFQTSRSPPSHSITVPVV
jgi:hypothetical protein